MWQVSCLPRFARKLIIHDPFAGDPHDRYMEALPVRHLAIVEAERLLVQAAEQVERLNRNIGPVDRPLQQTSEVFKPVSMYLPVYILDGMIYDLMLKVIQPFV